MSRPDLSVDTLIDRFGLRPLPAEGGYFHATWTSPDSADQAGSRPAGTAIIALLTARDEQFSAMHRLPADEIWHFYLGDPVELLLLDGEGNDRTVLLGHDVCAGQHVQFVVPAGTWMGGSVAEGGEWSLFGCTVAPGFVPADYEGGDAEQLRARYPRAAERISRLCRPGAPLRMAGDAAPDTLPASAEDRS
ncbi:cupin domain-containing protein [Streptomyces sp. NPDC056987]|uniref:cupin domain-containing protein n=1 Tax=Streptomyces sp. NPDC056987 TaxID=3345988 RepID=UPI003633AB4C